MTRLISRTSGISSVIEVLMLHGKHRQLDAGHPPDLARPQSAGVDDVFGMYAALVRFNIPGAVGARRRGQYAGAQEDVGAPFFAAPA